MDENEWRCIKRYLLWIHKHPTMLSNLMKQMYEMKFKTSHTMITQYILLHYFETVGEIYGCFSFMAANHHPFYQPWKYIRQFLFKYPKCHWKKNYTRAQGLQRFSSSSCLESFNFLLMSPTIVEIRVSNLNFIAWLIYLW